MLKLRPYVGHVKTPVLHIVVQLLIRGDSSPKRHLTRNVYSGGTPGLSGLWAGVAVTGEFESKRMWVQGQFTKSGATVESEEKGTVINVKCA